MIKKISNLLMILLVIVFLCPQNGFAEDFKRDWLNKKVVTAFIQKVTDVTHGATTGTDIENIQDFLERHIHEDARFKSTISYAMPGFPPQNNDIKLNKDGYIKQILEGASHVQNYDVQVDIKDIKFSRKKKTATVSTHTRENAYITVPGPSREEQNVPITGTTNCTQVLKINNDNILQMYHANCTTNVNFTSL
jgi:hypothetical protein